MSLIFPLTQFRVQAIAVITSLPTPSAPFSPPHHLIASTWPNHTLSNPPQLTGVQEGHSPADLTLASCPPPTMCLSHYPLSSPSEEGQAFRFSSTPASPPVSSSRRTSLLLASLGNRPIRRTFSSTLNACSTHSSLCAWAQPPFRLQGCVCLHLP